MRLKEIAIQLEKLYCFYGSDMEYFSVIFCHSVLTGKSSEPCMDLRAYISLRQRSIDLRRNLWSVDIEQCVMHGLHSNTIPVRAVHEYQKL